MLRSEPRAAARFVAAASFAVLAMLLPIAAPAATVLSPEGDSHVSAAFGRARVDVDLTARAHALAGLEIRVDGVPLAVPAQAWAGLGDATSADLARRDDGRFVLRLAGGQGQGQGPGAGADGAPPWVAEIVFDRLGLRGRRLLDATTGEVKQDVEWGPAELLD